MFENLMIVAVAAVILWVGLLVIYMISSQQQQKLEKQLEHIETLLGPEEDEAH